MEEYQILILSLKVGKINISIEKGIYLAPQSRHVQSLLLLQANLISRKNPLFFIYMVKPYHPPRALEEGVITSLLDVMTVLDKIMRKILDVMVFFMSFKVEVEEN